MERLITVALVEDTDEIRDAMRVLLNDSEGFSCTDTYPNAEDALQQLPAKKMDIVLMDINLPEMDGIECMRKLKLKMPETQFMICTVYDDDDKIFSALESGASGYILKRTSPAKILEAIRDLHNGGSPMSSEIARRVIESLRTKKLTVQAQSLTAREKQILDFLSKGFLYKEIATELFISRETVKKHIHNIYDKLQVQSRTAALNKAFNK
jgi:DNA-binding NarL/FixJ family response regulator